MIKVYCAGKIGRGDWRHKLFPELDRVSVEQTRDKLSVRGIPPRAGDLIYSGPFFCSDVGSDMHGCDLSDHCYHDELRQGIVKLCMEQIAAADVVFAWVGTDLSAYGTLAEIGYARGIKKPVRLYVARADMDLWFVERMTETREAENAEAAWGSFAKWATHYFVTQRLRTMPYDQYLQTSHWKTLRLKKLEEVGRRCQLCNSEDRLDVHHRSYEHRGEEPLNDLTVLCRPCHAKFHGKMVVERKDPLPNHRRLLAPAPADAEVMP